MITRIVRLTFRAGEVDNFKSVFESSKDLIRNFEGCYQLKLLESANIFFTYSIWESDKHLNAYRESELFKCTWAKTKILFEEPAEAWTCTETEVSSSFSSPS